MLQFTGLPHKTDDCYFQSGNFMEHYFFLQLSDGWTVAAQSL